MGLEEAAGMVGGGGAHYQGRPWPSSSPHVYAWDQAALSLTISPTGIVSQRPRLLGANHLMRKQHDTVVVYGTCSHGFLTTISWAPFPLPSYV